MFFTIMSMAINNEFEQPEYLNGVSYAKRGFNHHIRIWDKDASDKGRINAVLGQLKALCPRDVASHIRYRSQKYVEQTKQGDSPIQAVAQDNGDDESALLTKIEEEFQRRQENHRWWQKSLEMLVQSNKVLLASMPRLTEEEIMEQSMREARAFVLKEKDAPPLDPEADYAANKRPPKRAVAVQAEASRRGKSPPVAVGSNKRKADMDGVPRDLQGSQTEVLAPEEERTEQNEENKFLRTLRKIPLELIILLPFIALLFYL